MSDLPTPPTSVHVGRVETPVGPLLVASDAAGLRAVRFADAEGDAGALAAGLAASLGAELASGVPEACAALRAYVEGDLAAIDGLPVAPVGTPFQHRVWRVLRGIPAGTTTTYGEIARGLGSPGSSRAVGLANGANPIAVVIPCHRVVAGDGTLHGYAAGLDRKRWLLDHEHGAAGLTLFRGDGARYRR